MSSMCDNAHSELSDIYVTCQLVADNKPLTIPFRTSFKAFKNGYMYVYLYSIIYLNQRISQLERVADSPCPLL
jgi:hypothetical protein